MNRFKQWLSRACTYYTIIALAFLFVRLIMDGFSKGVISIFSFLLIFPCALALSAADLVMKSSIEEIWRRLSHFLISVFGIFLFLYIPSQSGAGFSRHMFVLLLICLLYWIVVLIKGAIKKRFSSMKEEQI